MKTVYKYIAFEEQIPDFQWRCVNRKSQDLLCLVSYYPRWRQWVMEPNAGTVFSVDCLEDVIHFIGQLPTRSTMKATA